MSYLQSMLALLLSVSFAMSGSSSLQAEETPAKQSTHKLLFKYPNANDLYVYYAGRSEPIAAVKGKQLIVTQQIDPPDVEKVTLLLTAHTFITIANNDRAKADYAGADKHYKMAIDVSRKASLDNEMSERAELALAGLYLKMTKSAEAEQIYKHWLAKVGSNGASLSDRAAILDNLAQALTQQRKLTEAEQYNQQSIAIYRKISPKPLIDIADCLNNLALIQIKQHKCTEAETNIKESIKITEELGNAKGRAIKYDTLASTYYCRGLFKEAAQAHEKALAMMQQTFGPNHPECAICLGSIAHCYMAMKDWDSASDYLQKAIKILIDSHGSTSPAARQMMKDLDLCLGQKTR